MTDWTKIVRAVADPRAKRPDPAIVEMIADHAEDVFARYGITTIRRQAASSLTPATRPGIFRRSRKI
jgi:hypothetical protein